MADVCHWAFAALELVLLFLQYGLSGLTEVFFVFYNVEQKSREKFIYRDKAKNITANQYYLN